MTEVISRGGSLSQRWLAACITGELLGFVPPALTGALLVAFDRSEAILVAGLVIAGIGEGLILGVAQQRVLRDEFPGVTRWVAATGLAAGCAWLAGMGGSSLVANLGPSALLVVVPTWVLGLLSMGVLQAQRLRSAGVSNVRPWIWSTTIAWLLGVTIPVVALSLIPNQWPLILHVLTAIVAAVAMGAVVGLITGRTLRRLRRQP